MDVPHRPGEPMRPNPTVENTSPNLKRKVVTDDVKKAKGKLDESNGVVEKKLKIEPSPVKQPPPLVELKGRKLVFHQESFSKNTPRRRLLNFETFLLDCEEAKKPVTEIPEEFWDIIVAAGHELSSSNETLFIKHLKSAMEATKSDPDRIPNDTLAPLIPKLFTLKQYGFFPTDFHPSSSSSSTKIPAALQIRCWEANEIEKYFPAEQVDILISRRAEREKARNKCLSILEDMDDIEKLELIRGEKGEKVEKVEKAEKEKTSTMQLEEHESHSKRLSNGFPESRTSREGTANTAESSRRSVSPVRKGKMTPEEEEAARIKKEERDARKALAADKKAAIAEKQAAKEREEEKKKNALAKQTAMFSSFLVPKAKPSTTSLISKDCSAGPSIPKLKENPVESDFSKTFKAVVQRPHVEWAPVNRWVKPRKNSTDGQETSVVDPIGEVAESSVSGWQQTDFIRDHLKRHGLRSKLPRSHIRNGLKTDPPHSVQEIWAEYQTAADPRKVANQLQNRRKFPWKTLAFDLQARPPYSGTFTKKSLVVGPRTPFAQDPVFDYSYDSGDDWQDDEGGEDVDDPDEGIDVEDDDDDESEGEFDDWLDDSEDVVEDGDADGDILMPDVVASNSAIEDRGRLALKVVKKSRDIPKKVVKLNPYFRGPVWETVVGQAIDGLEGYRIQLLNDTPVSLDPFNYISSEAPQQFKSTYSDTVIGINIGVKCLIASEPINVGKQLPIVAPPSASTSTPLPSTTLLEPPKSRQQGPKIAFPPSHLPELLRLIDGNTKIRTDLVSQLKAHFDSVTSKAAIEAKIKEVAVREGKSKDSQWKVRPEAWAAAGVVPPGAVEITIV